MSSIKYSFIPSSFDGKVILITGSSSGVGAGTALHFAKLNANLVINGRDGQKVSSVAEECRKWTKNRVLEVIADLQNESHIKNLVQKTVDTFGRIDVLVNSAGIIAQNLMTDSNYMQSFDQLMKTNLQSVVLTTILVVPYLERTKGCIVNVSSITSQITRRSWSAYGISKSGIDMFTKCMAMELGPKGIRVNAINPGLILTPMLNTLNDDSLTEEGIRLFCEATYPLGRPGFVDDMAKAIEFLASENSSFITGALLVVDGGCVIGSSAGIGERVALFLAKLGFNLMITGRDSQRIKKVVENCILLPKQKVKGMVADLLIDSDVQNLLNKTIEEFGRLDLLANCAQISIPSSIEESDVINKYMKVFKTNVRSVVLITTLAVPHLVKTKGSIINLSSDSELRPYESEFAFGVSEAAIDWFTKGLALEMKHKGIAVLSLNTSLVMRDEFQMNPWFCSTLHSRL